MFRQQLVKTIGESKHSRAYSYKNQLFPSAVEVKAGDVIKMDASDSFDPDADKLKINWWIYKEAGGYKGNMTLSVKNGKVRFKVPKDIKPNETIHLICEVSDNGTPSLTRYKRIILHPVSNVEFNK